MEKLRKELLAEAGEGGIALSEGDRQIDDVLTYALFPQVGLKFLKVRSNPNAFEPVPNGACGALVTTDAGEEVYTVTVEGQRYTVAVSNSGDITEIGRASRREGP